MTDTGTDNNRLAPQRLLELGHGLALWKAHIDDLHEQELNARVQPPAAFDRLQGTIARDSRLESLPFCALLDNHIEIISGHHRTRAARAAGVPVIHVVVDETGLSRDQIAAKQLAHNAIGGVDDPQLVTRIYQQIADVDARLESYVFHHDGMEAAPDPVSLPKLDLTIDYRTVLITFLPHQADLFLRAVDQLNAQADLNRDHLFLVDLALFDQWQAATTRLRKEYNARALSTVIARMIDAVAELLGIEGRSPQDLDPYAHVPLAEILGTAVVPPDLAALIETVIADAVRRKDVTKTTRLKLLETVFVEHAERHQIDLTASTATATP